MFPQSPVKAPVDNCQNILWSCAPHMLVQRNILHGRPFELVGVAGSAVAFGKLHGVLASKPLALPGKNAINIGLAAGNAVAAATFLTTGDPTTAVAALGATTVLGGIQGAHMTASIGGKTRHLTNSHDPPPRVQLTLWLTLVKLSGCYSVTPTGPGSSPCGDQLIS